MIRSASQANNQILPDPLIAIVFAFLSKKDDIRVVQVCVLWRWLFLNDRNVIEAHYRDDALSERDEDLLKRRLARLQPGPEYLEKFASSMYFTRKINLSFGAYLVPNSEANLLKIIGFLRKDSASLSKEEIEEMKALCLPDRKERLEMVQNQKRWMKRARLEIAELEKNFPLVCAWGKHYIYYVEVRLQFHLYIYSRIYEEFHNLVPENGQRIANYAGIERGNSIEQTFATYQTTEACLGFGAFFFNKLLEELKGKILGSAASDSAELIKHLGYSEFFEKIRKLEEEKLERLSATLENANRIQHANSILNFYNEHLPNFNNEDILGLLSFPVLYMDQLFLNDFGASIRVTSCSLDKTKLASLSRIIEAFQDLSVQTSLEDAVEAVEGSIEEGARTFLISAKKMRAEPRPSTVSRDVDVRFEGSANDRTCCKMS